MVDTQFIKKIHGHFLDITAANGPFGKQTIMFIV